MIKKVFLELIQLILFILIIIINLNILLNLKMVLNISQEKNYQNVLDYFILLYMMKLEENH